MDKIRKEGDFFTAHNSALTRAVAWSAIPQFRQAMAKDLDIAAEAKRLLAGRSNLHALTFACGDMTGEYPLFKKLGAAHIEAYDVSEGKKKEFFEKVYDGAVPVDYHIADANTVQLTEGRYDVVYMQQSYHHIIDVEHLAGQIRRALRPDGFFLLNDYIGPNHLQRSEAQRRIARRIWRILPERLRVNPQGKVLDDILIPPKSALSPCEAVNSEQIMPALRSHFDFERVSFYGGLLFPLFNGFARNYGNEEDLFLRSMWEMDLVLMESGVIEPNFIRAIMRPKKTGEGGDTVTA